MSEFTEFLKRDPPANIIAERAAHRGGFGKDFNTARRGAAKCPLLSVGVVSFTGPDAVTFINGQFTTNCLDITPAHSQFSAWCDPKGRVLFLFTLYRDTKCIYALLPKTQISEFMARLQRYVLRADVQLENLTDSISVFGITRNIKTAQVDTTGLIRPWAQAQSSDRTASMRYGPGAARFVIVGPDTSAVARWAKLQMPAVGEEVWIALDIFGGLPRLDERTSGQFLPQNLNLDALDGLSFSKGCYPGQEIIARLKYRTKVRKRLFTTMSEAACDPVPGSRILTPGGEHTVGQVLCGQRLDPARSVISAVIEIDAAGGKLTIEDADDTALRLIDLPYAVD